MGRVVPDKDHSGMWRSVKLDGILSDTANLSSNIHAFPSRVDLSWERAANSSWSVMELLKSAKLECE
jgi:hypothetical protein